MTNLVRNYQTGNLVSAVLEGQVDYMIHCCNAQGVMGSGIALEVRNRIPAAYDEYADFCDSGLLHQSSLLGQVVVASGVCNLIGQDSFNANGSQDRHANYEALATGLETLNRTLPQGSDIGVPYRMASDRAGGNWNIVEVMVLELLDQHNVIFYRLPNKD